ncbi:MULTISPECIES: LA2681 family HEPN domain-containing protein [Fusobacterium]|nr:LA2681 family HEPN domain-containing protein [Fusobacterium ulcerans]
MIATTKSEAEQFYLLYKDKNFLEIFELDEVIQKIGILIDSYKINNDINVIEKGISTIKELEKKEKEFYNKNYSILCYFLGNAYSEKYYYYIKKDVNNLIYLNYLAQEVYYYRAALEKNDFDNYKKCQVLCNLGNALSSMGRLMEGLKYCDEAIKIDSTFGMAYFIKAEHLLNNTRFLYDNSHTNLFVKQAYKNYKKAIKVGKLEDKEYYNQIKEKILYIESCFPLEFLNEKKDFIDVSYFGKEKEYRKWGIENNLFLNPLNSLYDDLAVAEDILHLPDMIAPIEERIPYFYVMFNNIKHEFISIRYMYFEYITDKNEKSISDNDVLLYDSGQDELFSFQVEKLKLVFRMAYSLFDKIAYFINFYYKLNIPLEKINFKNIWSQENKDRLLKGNNWILHSLYWINLELYDKNHKGILLNKEAKKINSLRNFCEHRIVQVTKFPIKINIKPKDAYFNISLEEFEEKTDSILHLVKNTIIYLSLSINVEERKKKTKNTFPMFLKIYDLDENI